MRNYPDFLFKANRNGKLLNERVQPWKWQWKAIYSDGTELHQFIEDATTQDDQGNTYRGLFHQLSEIDQSKLDSFLFINIESGVKHSLKFNPSEMKLICYYQKGRQFIFTNQEKGEGYYFYYVLHNFGYKKRGEDKEKYSIVKILPDDTFVLTDDPELMIDFK